MEWFSMLAAAVLFAAACNFDTVLLAMGWAVRGVRPSFFHTLVIAGLTTLITWLSLVLGRGAAGTLGGIRLLYLMWLPPPLTRPPPVPGRAVPPICPIFLTMEW